VDDPNYLTVPLPYVLLVQALALYMCLSMFDALRDKRIRGNARRNIVVILFFNLVVTMWSASYIF
jgi:hypothetical protein